MAKNKMVGFHDCETGEFFERPMNEEELAQLAADVEAGKLRDQKEAEAKAQRAALLDKLGLTEDEAKLLLS